MKIVALDRLRVQQNVFLVLKQLHCCPRLNVRVYSSKVELAAAGWHDIVTCQRLVKIITRAWVLSQSSKVQKNFLAMYWEVIAPNEILSAKQDKGDICKWPVVAGNSNVFCLVQRHDGSFFSQVQPATTDHQERHLWALLLNVNRELRKQRRTWRARRRKRPWRSAGLSTSSSWLLLLLLLLQRNTGFSKDEINHSHRRAYTLY